MKFIRYSLLTIVLLFLVAWSPTVTSQTPPPEQSLLNIGEPPFLQDMENLWVDSVLSQMTLEEKIGQLFMVAAYSNKSIEHQQKISELIKKYKIGGLIFFQGTAQKEISLTNYYQSISKVPLLIAGDWEWGLSMRLKNTIYFPRQMMLGAIRNTHLIYEMGAEIAREIRLVGGHVNFAPVVDINNNPNNPVIGSRSFGEDKALVFEHSFQYMKGLQDNGILAVAKHFPGHGDTDVDSHKALPIIRHSRARLDSVELYPFRRLFSSGIGGVMVAHLFVPTLDSTPHTATTLSYKVTTDLLRKTLNFKGIAFTDALNMKGVSQYFKPGEVDLKALMAGNDVLLFPKDVPTAIRKIKEAISSKQLLLSDLEQHVKKILALKYWSGLSHFTPTSTKDIQKKLNTPQALLLRQRLVENALTLIRNKDNILPIHHLEDKKIASVSIGNFKANTFQKTLQLYGKVDAFTLKKYPTAEEWQKLLLRLKDYNLVIFGLHKPNRVPKKNYGMPLHTLELIRDYAQKKDVVLDVFANPYILKKLNNLDVFKAIIISYNDWSVTQKASAQLIFGGIPAQGQLPISINAKYPIKTGFTYEAVRLKYSSALDAGINDSLLYKIDSIAINAIREGAMPGCQILAARNGKVFYNKSFGYFTYQRTHKVKNTDIYDLASMTKILATTASLMKLQDQKKLNIQDSLAYYLEILKGSNKSGLLIKDVLAHQARLKPWIPFYMETIREDSIKKKTYKSTSQEKWTVQVAHNLFIDSTYKDTIIKEIIESKLRKREGYKYSDLGYYLLQKIVEKQAQTALDKYVSTQFYKGIGCDYMGYKPLKHFTKNKIIPTEDDHYFRNQIIQGYVHDMGAAMLGGVGGHAGLFSNANDIAKMMQMYLNGGTYGGRRYLSEKTLKLFTTCVNCPDNRRGIGFDKPEMSSRKIGPTCELTSAKSFGHTGFTGTMTWADPQTGILYVFLSNRTFPTAENKKLITMNIRTKIQRIIYQSVKQ